MGCKASKELPEAQILTAPVEGGAKGPQAISRGHAHPEGDAAVLAAEAADMPQPLPSIVHEAASMSGSLDSGSPTRRRSSMERAGVNWVRCATPPPAHARTGASGPGRHCARRPPQLPARPQVFEPRHPPISVPQSSAP